MNQPEKTTRASVTDLRRLTPAQLEGLGQQSLRDHLLAQAEVAREKYAPFTADQLEAMLHDPECLRHPVRLVFEFGEMAMHQFAHPDIDWRDPTQNGRVLYLRPLLKQRADLLPLAVAYMIPLINYGDVVADGHCLLYGATLLGMTEDDYYRDLCSLADSLGAEARRKGGTTRG